MALKPDSRARFNLERASIMVLEPHRLGMDILIEILCRFGAKNVHRCYSGSEAKDAVEKVEIDLIIVDAMAGEGHDFVRWLRRCEAKPNNTAPVLLVAGHTPAAFVAASRDAGAHFVMTKPLTPSAVLERILWIAREGRQFISCDTYVGPDRRFKNTGVPVGMKGRRRTDVDPDAELGDAKTPNLQQADIDGMLKPQRVRL